MSAGFSSDLPNLSSKVQGLRGFIEKGSIDRLISFKSFNSAKIAEGFGKSLISRPLSSVRSMFLRYREVIGLQVEAFWKRNYLFIIGAGGLVLCIVLWRILFGLASIFVGISEGIAKYGFLALATAIVAFTHEMKLLAVDIPMASGPDQRIFLIGHEQEYRVGGGLISELRDPIVKAMVAEKEFEALDLKEEEDDEKKEREEAERKQRDKEQRVLENEKRQRELESLEKNIRRGMSSLRGASLFPHSIRSTSTIATATATATATTNLRNKPASAKPPLATHKNRFTNRTNHNNESMPKNFDSSEAGDSKRIDMKVYRGSILPKEDQRTLNWLQNLDEKANETHLFDHRFDPNFHHYVTIPHHLVNL